MLGDASKILTQALSHPLSGTNFGWGRRYEGKVRDNYTTSDGRRILVVTDRVSAFDRILGTLPLKGQLLNAVAAFWFEETRSVVPNHVLAVPDPNVLVARECSPLPVEMVVRAYLTGTTSTSIWVHYSRGERVFCGHRLPDGLREHQRLPEPILTPSTKAAHGDHDVSASREEILKDVWREDSSRTNDRTIDVHIRALRRKIPPLTKHIISIYGVGYKYEK